MRKILLLAGALIPSGLAAQAPQNPSIGSADYLEIRARGHKLNDMLRRARQGDDASLKEEIAPDGLLIIESPDLKSSRQVMPLTAANFRDWIGACIQLDQVSVSTGKGGYWVQLIFQCATKKVSGDFRGVFTFQMGRLVEAYFVAVVSGSSAAKAQETSQQPSVRRGNGPMSAFLDEHEARVTKIGALLDAMAHRDQKAFLALGGDKVFFSSDPEAIYSAIVASRAARLTIDTFAGLSSCKANRPSSIRADWYTVAWECPTGGAIRATQFSFKFTGRNLVAIQATRQPPKLKFN